MPDLPRRLLGDSGIEVSALSLGSWRTYERIPREQALAVLRAGRDAGIDFFDDARYDDESGTAPLRTGWSEVLFGELLRELGWRRDQLVLADKLWWELWPEQSALEELEGSLGRLGLDYLDLEYAAPLPDGLGVPQAVREIAPLIQSGKLRAWGVANWPAEQIAEAARVARDEELPSPCAAQLPYSLVLRSPVEDPEMQAALDGAGVKVVASATLAFGALSGKYSQPEAAGRLADELDEPRLRPALDAAASLVALAERLGTAPATLAYAFALAEPSVVSVLFGATRPEQVAENVAAAALLDRLAPDDLAELRRIGRG